MYFQRIGLGFDGTGGAKYADMPSHIKSSMLGVSLMLPVEDGRVRLGTWQGIWLGEHRIHGGSRRIVATLMGE